MGQALDSLLTYRLLTPLTGINGLTTFELGGFINTPEMRNIIEEILRKNIGLIHLKFTNCFLTNKHDPGFYMVTNALGLLDSLNSVSFEWEQLDDLDVKRLADVLSPKPDISSIYLLHDEIGDEGAIVLAELLKKKPTIKLLSIESNCIHNKGGLAIAKSSEHLNELALANNPINEEGVIDIVDNIPKNSSLKRLSLGNAWSGSIGNASVTAIGRLLRSNPNICVELWVNGIDDVGALELAGILQDDLKLTDLVISRSSITSAGIKNIIKALDDNTHLIGFSLNFVKVRINEELIYWLLEHLEKNLNLQSIDLRFYNDQNEQIKRIIKIAADIGERNKLMSPVLNDIRCQ